MQSMDFDLNLVFKVIQLILVSWIFMYYADRILKAISKYQDMKEKETDNQKIQLMMSIDPSIAEEEIDKLITKYFNDYITTEILAKNITYIKKDQVKVIMKEVTKSIIIDISELYVFYIRLLVNIGNEEQLTRFIYKKVKQQTLEFYVNFNKTTEQ